MNKQSWTDRELAVAVYFSSRNADHEACSRILSLKTANQDAIKRTAQSVRCKLDRIRIIDDL